MQNSSVELEIPFLGKFSPKNQNNQFQLKFNTESKSNIKNSIVMFTLFVYERYSFLRQICWSWNLEPRLIWICKTPWFFIFCPVLDLFCKYCPKAQFGIWCYLIWLISQQVNNFKVILKRKHFFYLTCQYFTE